MAFYALQYIQANFLAFVVTKYNKIHQEDFLPRYTPRLPQISVSFHSQYSKQVCVMQTFTSSPWGLDSHTAAPSHHGNLCKKHRWD